MSHFKKRLPSISFVLIALSCIVVGFQNCASNFDPDAYGDSSSIGDNNGADLPAPDTPPSIPTPPPSMAFKSCVLADQTVIEHSQSRTVFSSAVNSCASPAVTRAVTCTDGYLVDANANVFNPVQHYASTTRTLCDARTVQGSTVTNLVPNRPYLVSVYGVAPNKGERDALLYPVKVTNCQNVSLAQTLSRTINWADGNVPQSATLAITAPADGCIRAYVDDQVLAQTITVVERSVAGRNISGSQVVLEANKNYFVSVYGTTNGVADNIVLPLRVNECNSSVTLATTTSMSGKHPDGEAPISHGLGVKTGNQPCIEGQVEGNRNLTLNMTVFEEANEVRNINGNTATGLVPGEKYLVNVYSSTTYRGDGIAVLTGLRLVTCDSGAVIANTPSTSINWHDGSAPHSFGFVVTAPTDGCVRALGDGTVFNLSVVKVDR